MSRRSPAASMTAQPVLDLDYLEDSSAGTDANFVMTGKGGIVEIQGTAEGVPVQRGRVPGADGARQEGHCAAGRPAADGGGVRTADARPPPSSNPRSTSTDLDAAEAFYRDVLGLAADRQGRGPARLLPLRRRACCCCSTPRRRRIAAAAGRKAAGAAAWRGRRRAICALPPTADEIDDWKAASRRRRASPSRPISNGRTGGRSIYFRDPSGNSLEFAEPRIWGL